MAEKWQRWMPFHIDKFRGSPEVQAMHPAARLGYLYLLASCWQTSDCTVSCDPVDLATESGLGDEMWTVYGPRIVRKFEVIEGRLRNTVLFAEWNESRTVHMRRKEGAQRTNSARPPNAERAPTECSADTVTVTRTSTETKKQKPSRDKREDKVSDHRHEGCRAAVMAYGAFKGVKLQWDGSDAGQLALLLKSAPSLTLLEFQACLNHRARSPGTPHGERPRVWLPHILKYQQGPLNEFNRTGEVTDGKLGNNKANAANAALARAQERVIAQSRGNAEDRPHGASGVVLLGPGGGDGRDSSGVVLDSVDGGVP